MYPQAGKALEKRCTEIRIQLRPIAQSFYTEEDLAENELVIIVRIFGQILSRNNFVAMSHEMLPARSPCQSQWSACECGNAAVAGKSCCATRPVQVQPREAIYLKFYTKKPGLAQGLQLTELDLSGVAPST